MNKTQTKSVHFEEFEGRCKLNYSSHLIVSGLHISTRLEEKLYNVDVTLHRRVGEGCPAKLKLRRGE